MVSDIAGNVLASCYIPYIAFDIAALPPLHVGYAVGMLNLVKTFVGKALYHLVEASDYFCSASLLVETVTAV